MKRPAGARSATSFAASFAAALAACAGARGRATELAPRTPGAVVAPRAGGPWVLVPPLVQAGAVHSFALSPDETAVAVGTRDGVVSVWDVPTGRLRAWERVEFGEVRALAWSADGAELVAAGSGLDAWEASTGRHVRWDPSAASARPPAGLGPYVSGGPGLPEDCRAHGGHVSPGNHLAYCSVQRADGLHHAVFSVASGRELHRVDEPGALAWMPSGTGLYYGSLHARGWTQARGELFSVTVAAGGARPYEPGFVLLPAQGLLVSLHRRATYDLTTGRVAPFEPGPAFARGWVVATPRWLPSSRTLMVPLHRGSAGPWELFAIPEGRARASVRWPLHWRWWSADDELLDEPGGDRVALVGDDELTVVDASSGARSWHAATGALHAARWGEGGRTIVTVEDRPAGGISLVRRAVGAQGPATVLRELPERRVGNLQPVHLSPSLGWLAVLGDSLDVLDARTGAPLWSVARPLHARLYTDDRGDVLATWREPASEAREIVWFELGARRGHAAPFDPQLRALAVSPDGRWIAAASYRRVVVLDARTGATAWEARPGAERIRWIAGSGVLCVEDDPVRLWRARDGGVLTLQVVTDPASVERDRWFAWTSLGEYEGAADLVSAVRFRRGGLAGPVEFAEAASLGRGPTPGLVRSFVGP